MQQPSLKLGMITLGFISIVPKYYLSFIEDFSIIFSHFVEIVSGTAQHYALGSEWSGHQSVLSL